MNALSVGLQYGAQKRNQRAFGVGAGDMNNGRQPLLRVTESNQQAAHPVKRQIDALWVQASQDREESRAAVRIYRHVTDQAVLTGPALRMACLALRDWRPDWHPWSP